MVVGVDGSACVHRAVVVAPGQTGIHGWRLGFVTVETPSAVDPLLGLSVKPEGFVPRPP